jgi:uridine kinase
VDTEGIGESFDWKRLRDQVLAPLKQEAPARYQRYDWDRDALAEWHDVPAGGIVIVEGIYTTRKELWRQYDFRVWVDSPRSIRLSRGIARDGESVRHVWETEWMPAEDRYSAMQRPDLQADMVIDGSGASASTEEGLIAVARAPRSWFDG